MKFKLLFLSTIILLLSIAAKGQGDIDVTIKNIKKPVGSVRIGLFNNKEDFLKNAIEGKVVAVEGAEVMVTFKNLKPGHYALSVIHDENDNGELDTNFMGIPKEGFGFGNNAMGTFGPPNFDKAKITIEAETVKQEIEMKYF